jgi:serine protease Do
MIFAAISHFSAAGTVSQESEGMSRMKQIIQLCWAAGLVSLVLSVCADAQAPQEKPTPDPLQEVNAYLEQIPTKVSPSVVHIEVASYGPLADEDDDAKSQTLTKQRGSGSGVIVDPDGYIVTAFHVVEGARRIRVELDRRVHATTPAAQIDNHKPKSSFEAKIVGTFKEADVAVLKIDARNLPAISFSESDKLKQGQLVVALGNVVGLRNSLSLGVVSSVAQQIGANDSMVYIQTDAALPPGISGGPLVDIQGEMVGMNVFTITERGREEGLGFAIPSAMVRFIYEQIRQYGRVHWAYLGMDLQGVTPTLASALLLSTDSGVIVASVTPGSPAEKAALQAGDVLLSFDGTPLRSVPQLSWALLHKRPGDHVGLEVARKSNKIFSDLRLVEVPLDSEDSLAAINIDESLVAKLGVVGSARRHGASEPPSREASSGVLVVARLRGTDSQPDLSVGDVIRSVNGVSITSVAQLSTMIDGFKPGDAIALQVERKGKLTYVAFEMD